MAEAVEALVRSKKFQKQQEQEKKATYKTAAELAVKNTFRDYLAFKVQIF